MDKQVETLIFNKVRELTSAQKMYTAFDITKALRTENPTVIIKHYEVREYINRDFVSQQLGFYDRTLTKVCADGTEAFVYHVKGADVSEYLNPKTKTNADALVGTVLTPSVEGRITIPKKIWRVLSDPSPTTEFYFSKAQDDQFVLAINSNTPANRSHNEERRIRFCSKKPVKIIHVEPTRMIFQYC